MSEKLLVGVVNLPNANVSSWINFLDYYGIGSSIIDRPEQLAIADVIVLPGIGHFTRGSEYLANSNIGEAVVEAANSGTRKIIGICLGMHLLCKSSAEGAGQGLGIFDLHVRAFADVADRATNIGWSRLDFAAQQDQKVYFNHSFYIDPELPETISSSLYRGKAFSAAIRKDNVVGIQFHPEKSYSGGWSILKELFYE